MECSTSASNDAFAPELDKKATAGLAFDFWHQKDKNEKVEIDKVGFLESAEGRCQPEALKFWVNKTKEAPAAPTVPVHDGISSSGLTGIPLGLILKNGTRRPSHPAGARPITASAGLPCSANKLQSKGSTESNMSTQTHSSRGSSIARIRRHNTDDDVSSSVSRSGSGCLDCGEKALDGSFVIDQSAEQTNGFPSSLVSKDKKVEDTHNDSNIVLNDIIGERCPDDTAEYEGFPLRPSLYLSESPHTTASQGVLALLRATDYCLSVSSVSSATERHRSSMFHLPRSGVSKLLRQFTSIRDSGRLDLADIVSAFRMCRSVVKNSHQKEVLRSLQTGAIGDRPKQARLLDQNVEDGDFLVQSELHSAVETVRNASSLGPQSSQFSFEEFSMSKQDSSDTLVVDPEVMRSLLESLKTESDALRDRFGIKQLAICNIEQSEPASGSVFCGPAESRPAVDTDLDVSDMLSVPQIPRGPLRMSGLTPDVAVKVDEEIQVVNSVPLPATLVGDDPVDDCEFEEGEDAGVCTTDGGPNIDEQNSTNGVEIEKDILSEDKSKVSRGGLDDIETDKSSEDKSKVPQGGLDAIESRNECVLVEAEGHMTASPFHTCVSEVWQTASQSVSQPLVGGDLAHPDAVADLANLHGDHPNVTNTASPSTANTAVFKEVQPSAKPEKKNDAHIKSERPLAQKKIEAMLVRLSQDT